MYFYGYIINYQITYNNPDMLLISRSWLSRPLCKLEEEKQRQRKRGGKKRRWNKRRIEGRVSERERERG